MIPVLLILIPLIGGLISFFLNEETTAKRWALISSLLTLVVSLTAIFWNPSYSNLSYEAEWLTGLNSSFSVALDGMGNMLTLLTAIAFPAIFIATNKNSYSSSNKFYGLMLLTQAGLMGVFSAVDALLFYFFWELALIPVYFLCSIWGGERRIAVTFKFFIYTFLGSLLMLFGILYIYFNTPDHSFSLVAFQNSNIAGDSQSWLFWLFFVAFAIKMPIFPFHTWQPDTYEQSPTATTMVLSGVMVKMGVFGVIRWLLPVLPIGSYMWSDTVIWLSIAGMIYASILAIKQDDLKRLVAYSSIAHIGLMNAALFVSNESGMQGVMLQMFNHGINIIGLWIVVDAIETQFGTRKLSELGGIASKAPVLSILLVVMSLANIALPLTNAFVGEFLMFNGLFKYNVAMAAVAGISIILAAVYTLNMIQKVIYGELNDVTKGAIDIRVGQKMVLAFLVGIVFLLGVYPAPLVNLTESTSQNILELVNSIFK